MKKISLLVLIVQIALVIAFGLATLPSIIAPACSFSGSCSGDINLMCGQAACYSAGSCGTCYIVNPFMGSPQNHCYVSGGSCQYSCTVAPAGTPCDVNCPNFDQCDGSGFSLVTYESSTNHGLYSSSCGASNGICDDAICGTIQETCDTALECQTSLGCNGNLICHRDLRKFAPHLVWATKNLTADTTILNETAFGPFANNGDSDYNGTNDACEDGYDNDCDGLTDCADPDCCPIVSSTMPTSPLLNITIAGQDLLWLGSNGMLWTKGAILTNQASLIATGSDNFILKDSTGTKIVVLDGTPGSTQGTLYLKGSLFENQGPLAYPSGGNNLIIRNATAIIAYFDGQGNLYLMGSSAQNKIP